MRQALGVIAEAAAPGSLVQVPREVLLELLAGGQPAPETASPAPDLKVEEVAAHFKRSPTTVRAWLDAGLIPGAYKLRGRSWRVPVQGLKAMSSGAHRTIPTGPQSTPVTLLDAWRRSA